MTKTEKFTKVAVYGTLKKGNSNNRILPPGTFVADAVTVEKFTMYCNGWFPYVTKELQTSRVTVEIYEVNQDTLERLDLLEGFNPKNSKGANHYQREQTMIRYNDGTKELVDIYLSYSNNLTQYELIKSGVWMPPSLRSTSLLGTTKKQHSKI